MIIYKTTNLVNGKIYVGKDEKNNPEYLGSGKILKLVINKNGRDKFKKEILETCSTRKELNDREKYWIKELDSIKEGYNIAEGGTGGKTKFNTIPVYQFEKNGFLIKKWNSAIEAAKELSIDDSSIMKVCKGKLYSCGGWIWSYTDYVKQYKDPRTIKILQYDKDGTFIKEWESIIEIKNSIGISDRQMHQTLDKINKTAKSFIWLRKKDKIENNIEVPKSKYFNNKNAKKIKYERRKK